MTPTVEMLWDIEQIKQLKARYFRFLDTKDWESFQGLFTEDCKHWLPQESPKPYVTNEEYFRDLPNQLGNGVTTHHGHMPEITLLSEIEAEGVWAMFDYVQVDSSRSSPPDEISAATQPKFDTVHDAASPDGSAVQVEGSGGRVSIMGYGHYFETYRKGEDGQWRISSKRNVRLRLDQVPWTL